MQFNIKNTKSKLLFFAKDKEDDTYKWRRCRSPRCFDAKGSRNLYDSRITLDVVTEKTYTDKKQVDTIKIQIEIQIHIEN